MAGFSCVFLVSEKTFLFNEDLRTLVSNLLIGFEGYISSVDNSTYVALFSLEKNKAEKIYNFLIEIQLPRPEGRGLR